MAANNANRLRAFADLVSLDAWHENFTDDRVRAQLYADVTFRTARVGAEASCPLRFRLSLRRAEVHLTVPKTEPLTIDPITVARTVPEQSRKRTTTRETAEEDLSEARVGAALSGSSRGVSAQIKGGTSGAHRSSGLTRISELREVYKIRVELTKSPDSDYRWEVSADDEDLLQGAAWNAKEPRATLVLNTKLTSSKIQPGGVRFEVRCLREDLIINDVELKDPTLFDRLRQSIFPANKAMVAVQYIRDELLRSGLQASNVEDKFGLFTLAAAIAEG